MDCPAYFASVEARLEAEEERAASYLDATSSKPRLLDLLVDVFVTKQVRTSMVLFSLLVLREQGFVRRHQAGACRGRDVRGVCAPPLPVRRALRPCQAAVAC